MDIIYDVPVRVVVDTSVVVSALRSSHGASNRILETAAMGFFELLITPALFLEYEAVLSRPEQRRVHGRSAEEIELLMMNFGAVMVPVQIHFQWRPQLNDANDELVLEAAINGRADCIVTHNIRHFSQATRDFGIRVLRPREALKEVDLWAVPPIR